MTSSQRKRRRASDRLRVFPKDPDAQHLADHEIRHRLGDKDHLGRGRSNWPLIRSRTTTLPMSTRDVGPGQRSDANRAAQRALGAFVQRALPLQADPVQRPLVARAHGDIANVDHDCPPGCAAPDQPHKGRSTLRPHNTADRHLAQRVQQPTPDRPPPKTGSVTGGPARSARERIAVEDLRQSAEIVRIDANIPNNRPISASPFCRQAA